MKYVGGVMEKRGRKSLLRDVIRNIEKHVVDAKPVTIPFTPEGVIKLHNAPQQAGKRDDMPILNTAPPKVTIHHLAGVGIESLDEKDYVGAREVLVRIQDVAETREV